MLGREPLYGLVTDVVLRGISEFGIDTRQLHNDYTSISVHGAYRDAVGTARGGKPTVAVTWLHSTARTSHNAVGRNRIVRRVFDHRDHPVRNLGRIQLGSFRSGELCDLTLDWLGDLPDSVKM